MRDKCPVCGSENTATYAWGGQELTSELTRKMKEGSVKLGGACITFPCPLKHCNQCGADFEFVESFDTADKMEAKPQD